MVLLRWKMRSHVKHLLHEEISYQRKINCIFSVHVQRNFVDNCKRSIAVSLVSDIIYLKVCRVQMVSHIIRSLPKRLMCFSI